MSKMISMMGRRCVHSPAAALRATAISAVFLALLCGCHKGADEPHTAAAAGDSKVTAPAAAKEAAAQGTEAATKEPGAPPAVTLTPEQIEKAGVHTEPAKSIEFREETAGYGSVVAHETIAQAVAELVTARATQRLSSSVLARAHRLSGTPGAVSADVEETAAHQAAVDAAALTLTTQRLSGTLGMQPPWKGDVDSSTLRDLASGRIKLVRVTFPLGAWHGGTPASLRAAHIGAGVPGEGWKMTAVWDAPADATVPGRSFFALLRGSDVGEGERLLVWAPSGAPVAGVLVPAAAAVLSEGKYWCFVEEKPGSFQRTEIDTNKPTEGGYFVASGISAGDAVVTAAAGQLLARESSSGAEAE